MGKGGLIIDVLTGPPKGDADADEDDVLDEEDALAPASPKQKPEAVISGIESQLAQLRGLIAGL